MQIPTLLIPRTHSRACLQIALCLALFYLWPGLLPRWRWRWLWSWSWFWSWRWLRSLSIYLLLLAALATLTILAPKATTAILALIPSPPPQPPQPSPPHQKPSPSSIHTLPSLIATTTRNATLSLTQFLSHCYHQLQKSITALLKPHLTLLKPHLTHLTLAAQTIQHPISFVFFAKNIATTQNLLVPLRRAVRTLIWLALCLAHFLLFTLALSVFFPCLFTYGLVIYLLHQAASLGTRRLAAELASHLVPL